MFRFLLLVFLAVLPLQAAWEIKGSALYWRPCGGTFIVGLDPEPRIVNTDYDWGWRIGVAAVEGSNYWYGQFTRLESVASVEYRDPDQTARREVNYDTGSAGLALSCMSNRCLSLFVYGGPRYLDLEDRRTTDVVFERFAVKGYGGEVGLAGDVGIGGCAGLHAHLGGTMLIGQQVTRGFPSETTCIPGIDVRIASTYSVSGRGTCLVVEAGYDLTYYFAVLRQIDPIGVVTAYNMGFHGPYVGARLRF